MAHTYEDFVTQANKSGLAGQLSQSDMEISKTNPQYGMALLGLLQTKNDASTAEQRALVDETINQLRSNQGLQGQITEAQKQINNVGSFSYSGENAYQQALQDADNMPEFSYDKENDPVYRSMRQTARRESERAVADTLARASVGTGGVASSWAISAAQQAANNYTGALADAVPTLYQKALNEHQNEQDMRIKRLAALEEDKATELDAYNARLKLMYGNLEGLQDQLAEGNTAYTDKLNALNTSLGTLVDADIAMLKQSYPAGVADSNIWQGLVNRYGKGQLEAAGIKATGAAAIPADTMTFLQTIAPNGVVTNETYWKMLINAGLTEADLNAAGYRLGTAPAAGVVGGSPAWLSVRE